MTGQLATDPTQRALYALAWEFTKDGDPETVAHGWLAKRIRDFVSDASTARVKLSGNVLGAFATMADMPLVNFPYYHKNYTEWGTLPAPLLIGAPSGVVDLRVEMPEGVRIVGRAFKQDGTEFIYYWPPKP